jgi:tellurite resistance protein
MTAKKLLALASIPIRLGGAALLVFLAYHFPLLVLLLLILTLVAATAGLAASIVLRRAVRLRSRTRCAGCEYRPLVIARICPKCHTPLLARTVREMPPASAEAVLDSAVALAWANGDASPDERSYLIEVLKASGLSEDRQARLRERIQMGTTVEAITLPTLTAAEARQVLQAAAALVTVDGELLPVEVKAYDQLATRLGVRDQNARALLDQRRRLAWS